jgi:hypothetical protein
LFYETKKGFPNYDHPANAHLRNQPLGVGGWIAIGIITFASLFILVSFVQSIHGQMPTIQEQQKGSCESIGGTYDNGKCTIDHDLMVLRQQLENSIRVLQQKQQGFEAMINYCFQHADRPNPLQDLIDKGLMPANSAGFYYILIQYYSQRIYFPVVIFSNFFDIP